MTFKRGFDEGEHKTFKQEDTDKIMAYIRQQITDPNLGTLDIHIRSRK